MKPRFNVLILLASILFVTACEKHRDPVLPDGSSETIFSIDELKNYSTKASFDDAAPENIQKNNNSYPGGDQLFKLEVTNPNKKLTSLLNDIAFPASKGMTAKVSFEVTADFVSIVLTEPTPAAGHKLPNYLNFVKTASQSGVTYIARYPIHNYGQLVNSKTIDGESTFALRLQKTPIAQATHVQLDPSVSQRQIVSPNPDPNNKLFVLNELQGKVLTLAQIQDEPYNITIDESRLVYLDSAPLLFKLKFDPVSKVLFSYQILPNTARVKKQISRNAPEKSSSLLYTKCDVKELPESSRESFKPGCFGFRNVGVDVKFHQVKQEFDSSKNQLTSGYRLIETHSLSAVTVISIAASSKPPEVFEINEKSVNLIKVKDFSQGSFLFQRTLQENSSNYPYAFTGLMGPLEIVKFHFNNINEQTNTAGDVRSGQSFNYNTTEVGHLEIKRSKPLNPSNRSTDLDVETLFRFKVQYVKKFKPNSSSSKTLWQRASVNDPNAYALLDWSQNLLAQNSESASFKIMSQICLGQATAKEILPTAVVKPSKYGVSLGFTMRSTRNLLGLSCFQRGMVKGGFPNFTLQSSFNFLERFSFKKHNPENSKKVTSTIPNSVQRKFGLSFFTQQKLVPDQYNQTNKKESVQSQGILHDFTGGKSVTWILSGLPQETELRKGLIEQTEEVIANWNVALTRAFKGTPLDRSTRSSDYVKLIVDKTDRYKPYFGDLNYNFIYYEAKDYSTPVLGIALMGVNQESGLIERSNTVIYGGTIERAVGGLKRVAQAHKDYNDSMNIDRFREKVSSAADGSKEERGKLRIPFHQLSAEQLLTTGVLKDRVIEGGRNTSTSIESKIASFDESGGGIGEAHAVLKRPLGESLEIDKYELVTEIFRKTTELSNKSSDQLRSVVLDQLSKYIENKNLPQTDLESSIGSFKDQLAVTNNIIETLNKMPGIYIDKAHSELSTYHKEALKKSKTELMAEEYGSTLVHEMGHLFGLFHNFYGSYDKKNWHFDDELTQYRNAKIKAIKADDSLKTKFSSELNQKLAIRCDNLIDKTKVKGVELPSRTYSTVMDYMPLRGTTPGPWDVATVRLAYTGYLELSPSQTGNLKLDFSDFDKQGRCGHDFDEPKHKVAQNSKRNQNLIHIRDYINEYGLLKEGNNLISHQDWDSLYLQKDKDHLVKSFKYCDNSDEYLYSECNMHDEGTTPLEVIQYYVKNYQAFYHIRNLPSESNAFNWRQMYSYIFSRYYTFFKIRQFLDESVYEDRTNFYNKSGINYDLNDESNKLESFSDAVAYARDFFHSIIRTPEASSLSKPEERFLLHKYTDALGRTHDNVFEAKWTRDKIINSHGDLAYRGIEYDKALAILFLTQRGLGGIPEYQKDALWINFLDFEKTRTQPEQYKDMPTVKLLTDLLTGQVTPGYFKVNQGLISLKNDWSLQTSENLLVRQMTAFATGMSLQTLSLEAEKNIARLFYLNNSVNEDIPEGIAVLSALGEDENDPTADRYWTTDYATAAQRLFVHAKSSKDLIVNKEKIVNELTNIFNMSLSLGNDTNLSGEKADSYRELLKKRSIVLEGFLGDFAKGNISTKWLVSKMASMAERARTVYLLEDEHLNKSLTERELFNALVRERSYSVNDTKNNPLLYVAAEALMKSNIPNEIKERVRYITDSTGLKGGFYKSFGNIQFLRMIQYHAKQREGK